MLSAGAWAWQPARAPARSALRCQPSGGVLGVVGDHDVGPGAAQRGEDLKHHGALVDVAYRIVENVVGPQTATFSSREAGEKGPLRKLAKM